MEFEIKIYWIHCNTIIRNRELITQTCKNGKIIQRRKKSNGKFENYNYLTLSQTDINYLQNLNLDLLIKVKFLKEIIDEMEEVTTKLS